MFDILCKNCSRFVRVAFPRETVCEKCQAALDRDYVIGVQNRYAEADFQRQGSGMFFAAAIFALWFLGSFPLFASRDLTAFGILTLSAAVLVVVQRSRLSQRMDNQLLPYARLPRPTSGDFNDE